MIRTLFKITWRQLIHNRFNTILNIIGLTLGVACFLIIFTKIDYESGFDRFHSDSDRIYRIVRVTSGLQYLEGGLEYRTGVNFPLPNAIKNQIPELEGITQMMYMGGGDVRVPEAHDNTLFKEERGISFVEPAFFDMLDFEQTSLNWLIGNPETTLSQPFSVVLTQSMAHKYFGGNDPIGKSLEYNGSKYQVSGLISDFPENSDFQFTILFSLSTIQEINRNIFHSWDGLSDNFQCLVKVRPDVDPQVIEEKIHQIHKANTSAETAEMRTYKLQPLNEIHQDNRFGNYNHRIVSSSTIFALMSIGVLLIVMACINYSNLSIAQLSTRGKAAGIHKILGNTRSRQIAHLLFETLLLSLIATIIGALLSLLLIKNMDHLIGVPNSWNFFNLKYALFILTIPFIISVLAGLYPALLISKTNPVEMIRNKGFRTIKGSEKFSRWMVTFQFIIAQILIVCGLMIFRQLDFIESKDMGYDRKNILIVNYDGNDELALARFKNELLSNPNITSVSLSSISPGREGNYSTASRVINNERINVDVEEKMVDPSYLDTYGIRLSDGRNFSSDEMGFNIIANQKLIEELHFKDNNEAIGASVSIGNNELVIIGVVENFHSSPIYDPIRPCFLQYVPQRFSMASIRYKLFGENQLHTHLTGLINDVRERWQAVFPKDIFEYNFFDETIASYYSEERKTASLVHIFTGIMIFICCLGIIGLIHHTTIRKAKEVAVRKIIGATTFQMSRMLLRNLAEWVIIANLVAWPIAYFIMESWLENFAYQAELAWWIFVISGCIALAIALLTVCYHIIRAANVSPSKILKYE